ncbi:MAG: type II toxin-antitoxin system RatA family toxin [Variovorax sp.]
MKTIHKSVLLAHSAEQMYALVTDVASYPAFLPWCDKARVVETHADGVTAEIGLRLAGVRQSFTTRNTQTPPREVRLRLVKGPFSKLDGVWRFAPLAQPGAANGRGSVSAAADPSPSTGNVAGEGGACRVELDLSYGFDNFALSALVGPIFDKIAASLVDAFVKRADAVYGNA